jgi:DisA bacterial checkpoint controller nucleotide-binding
MGYEGKSVLHTDRKDPTGTNDDMNFWHGAGGASWLISVGLLHSRFIAVRETISPEVRRGEVTSSATETGAEARHLAYGTDRDDDEGVVDVERSYPNELAERVRETWPADGYPLPKHLVTILDVAYHASFLRDEERPVTGRILVLPASELPLDTGPPASLLPLRFGTPRRFEEDELRRLSPAAPAHRALVAVDESGDELGIWGLVQSGPRWLQAAQGGRAKEPSMPPCLVVRIVRPGHLLIGCGNRVVAELRGGRLSDFTLDVFQSRWLPSVFREARAAMANEHRASARVVLDERVAADLTGHLAQQMVKRIVATMRSVHHGGTIVIGPPDCVEERYLQTKYTFFDSTPRRRFRSLVLSILEAIAEHAAAVGRAASVDLYRAVTDPRIAELDEGLFELGHLIASLAAVDGAVVMTKRFEILGFGAEIAGSLPAVTEVRRAVDLEADTFVTELVDSVGTRHRSAYRFCSAVPDAVALVVSQDGSVRFVNRHRDSVTYWDHGLGGD